MGTEAKICWHRLNEISHRVPFLYTFWYVHVFDENLTNTKLWFAVIWHCSCFMTGSTEAREN